MGVSLARLPVQANGNDDGRLADALASVWGHLVRLCERASAPFVPRSEAGLAWDAFSLGLRRALAREAAVLPELIATYGLRDDRPRLRLAHGQLLVALDEAAQLRERARPEPFVDAIQDLMTRMVAHDVWQRRCVAPILERRLPPLERALAVAQLTADAANDH
jgi:hypothetical protein